MFTNWKLPFAAVGSLLLTTGTADAQDLTVQANYQAAMPPVRPDETCQPGGTWTLPNNPGGHPPHRIVLAFGTQVGGKFVEYNGAPTPNPVVLNVGYGGGPIGWGYPGTITLTNRPAGCQVQAKLQRLGGNGLWSDVVIKYAACGP